MIKKPKSLDWKAKRVKDLGNYQSGDSVRSVDLKDQGFPVYGGNGFRGYFDQFNHDGDYILIGRQGALCGNINYATGKFWATEHAIVVYPKSKVNINWYGRYLESMNLNQYSLSAAQPGLSVETIKRLNVYVPPFTEQTRIARYLDRHTALLDQRVALLEQKADAYRRLLRAQVNQAVCRGLRPDAPLKDSGIAWLGQVPEHWEVRRIKDTTKVKARIGWQGLRSSEFLTTSDYFCVTGTDFKEGRIDWSNAHCVEKERYDQDRNIQLKIRDLLLTKDGTIGKVAIIDELPKKATLNSGVFVIRPKRDAYLNEFMYWILVSGVFQSFIDLMKNGSTINHLYQNVFVQFAFALPPLEEQRAIATHLEAQTQKINAIIALISRQVDTINRLRQALINEVVTGQRRV